VNDDKSTLAYVQSLIDAMSAADAALLRAIHSERDPAVGVTLLMAYYDDLDRAERTPRDLIYYHLGMLASLAQRCLAALPHVRRPDTTMH